jgi:SdpI/YfhL protein family
MDMISITVGASWLFTGLLIIGLAIPLVRGRIGRNGWYGIRLPESFRSDEAWYAINRFGAKRMIAWAIPLIFVGLVSVFLPLQQHARLAMFLGFAPLIFILVPALQAWRFARHYGANHGA